MLSRAPSRKTTTTSIVNRIMKRLLRRIIRIDRCGHDDHAQRTTSPETTTSCTGASFAVLSPRTYAVHRGETWHALRRCEVTFLGGGTQVGHAVKNDIGICGFCAMFQYKLGLFFSDAQASWRQFIGLWSVNMIVVISHT